MAFTPSRFKLIYPAFDAETDERITFFAELAQPHLDETRWGGFYEQGMAAYIAHSLAIANTAVQGNGAQDITLASKVGDVSYTNSEMMLLAQQDEPLKRTTYGAEYLRLRRFAGMGAVAV